MGSFFYLLFLLLAIITIMSFKTLREDERLVIIRLGRFLKITGPGIVVTIPFVDRGIRVDLNKDVPGWHGLSKIDLEEKIKAFVLSKP